MYIMCVCLFSALSFRVGALQISIIYYYLLYMKMYLSGCEWSVLNAWSAWKNVPLFNCCFVVLRRKKKRMGGGGGGGGGVTPKNITCFILSY